jgi:predicted esterase
MTHPIQRHYLAALLAWCGTALLVATPLLGAEVGHQPDVAVAEPTRIDWVFAVANQSLAEPPADWMPDYRSTNQKYELFVPGNYDESKSWPLVLFISAGDRPAGFAQWKAVCEQEGVLFASPHGAGNSVDTKKRVRIILDVLDDVRRKYNVDPDRTYIGGFSGGGRIACAIGFSLPEYFGGVIPVCSAGDLRDESWLRHRVIDRLSVAHLTGENDFNRGEVERFRGPMLADVGVRSKVWVAPKMGHGIPDSKVLLEASQWLDESSAARGQLAKRYPATRAAGVPPTREEQAKLLAEEAEQRLAKRETKYSGLMLLKGVLDRWPDLPPAAAAKKVLLEAEQSADTAWQADDIAEQRKFLIARARRLSDYALGPLPDQYANQRKDMAAAAAELWNLVIEDGQDAKAVAEGKAALPKLREIQS